MWRPDDWGKHFRQDNPDPRFREVFELGASAILESLTREGFLNECYYDAVMWQKREAERKEKEG